MATQELDTILDNIFSYLEVGESGLHFATEEHRQALKHSLEDYIAKREKLARKEGSNKMWGQTYNFLHPRHKELCSEWDDYIIAQ